MQVRLWTIIGESRTGKSHTIKTLIAHENGAPPFTNITLRGGGYLQIFPKVMAWQEDCKTPSDSVQILKDKVKSRVKRLNGKQPAFVNILSALRLEAFACHKGVACPSAEAYLAAWLDQGWELASLVLMSPDEGEAHRHFDTYGAPTIRLSESRDMPAAQMVGAVRNHFDWS